MTRSLRFEHIVHNYSDNRFIVVECPEMDEWVPKPKDEEGNPIDSGPPTVTFRTKLTVADYEWLLEQDANASAELKKAQLFFLLACQEDGEPLIPRDGYDWKTKMDVTVLAGIVLRADLEAKVWEGITSRAYDEAKKKDVLMAQPMEAMSQTEALRQMASVGRLLLSPSKEDGAREN